MDDRTVLAYLTYHTCVMNENCRTAVMPSVIRINADGPGISLMDISVAYECVGVSKEIAEERVLCVAMKRNSHVTGLTDCHLDACADVLYCMC
jgi:hypothetical protein